MFSALIAAYLFLGGTGAGLFFWGVFAGECVPALALDGTGANRRVWGVALGLLLLGAVCLTLDLGRVENIFAMFFSLKANFLSAGAWALVLVMACALAFVMLAGYTGGRKDNRRWWRGVTFAVEATGALGSLYLMVYTGLLLRMESGIDLWNSNVLPVLFLASSLAAGFAAYELIARPYDLRLVENRRFSRVASRVDALLVFAEVAVALWFVFDATAQPFGSQAIPELMQGWPAALFFAGFGGLGILVPAVADVVMMRQEYAGESLPVVAISAMAGACSLRFALVMAGINVLY